VSLSTAAIEFLAATILLIFFKKSMRNRFYALFIYALGFYQFTEFMLCTSNSLLWAKLGFLTYTFLPAMLLHFIIRMTNIKFKNILLYIFPVIFSVISLIEKNFIILGECTRYFVSVQTMVSFAQNKILFFSYVTYYFGFIIFSCFLLNKKYKKERNKIKRIIYFLMLIAILATLIPPITLFLIFPSFGVVFPSLYCEFAVLSTFAALLSAWIDR